MARGMTERLNAGRRRAREGVGEEAGPEFSDADGGVNRGRVAQREPAPEWLQRGGMTERLNAGRRRAREE